MDFERPLNMGMRQIRKAMVRALQAFLESDLSELPYILPVTEDIEFTIYPSSQAVGRVFRLAGGSDDDAGGWVIPIYIENLRHCISEKSKKVMDYLANYQQWWLYLVDHMGWGLDGSETQDIVSSISDIGVFDGVFILSNSGTSLLASKYK
jgi:hypothetical protein